MRGEEKTNREENEHIEEQRQGRMGDNWYKIQGARKSEQMRTR